MIHIGDYTVPAYTSQMTTPSLKIRTSDGSMFYVPMIAEDMCIATGNTELYYEETDINTCKEITLPAGCWRVELSGGFGQGLCGSDDDIYQTGATETYTLRLNTETQIYVFRGGDGSAPAAYVAGTGIGGGGGGATCWVMNENSSVTCNSGTDGGSGSTGTSDTSYVKIYRL